jgi:hypothetical protein
MRVPWDSVQKTPQSSTEEWGHAAVAGTPAHWVGGTARERDVLESDRHWK